MSIHMCSMRTGASTEEKGKKQWAKVTFCVRPVEKAFYHRLQCNSKKLIIVFDHVWYRLALSSQNHPPVLR